MPLLTAKQCEDIAKILDNEKDKNNSSIYSWLYLLKTFSYLTKIQDIKIKNTKEISNY